VAPLSLRTPRLLLREWRDDDLDAFAAMAEDPAVMQYLLPLQRRAASDALAARIRADLTKHGFGLWAVEIPGVKPFVGMVGLAVVGFEAHFTPAIEVGWRLAPAYWGQGYATEAAFAAMDHGFHSLDLGEIVAFTVPANMRSRRLMQHLHMTRSRQEDFDHPRVPEGHPLKRHFLYRMRREDWRGR
jgi:RimJ/RimL family protein N-acetyltransferase